MFYLSYRNSQTLFFITIYNKSFLSFSQKIVSLKLYLYENTSVNK
ncbi:hypothetical protein T190130A13A_70089 [Tenacibaculum sp. 190130A14a]